jgi:5,5'-dehydrodivanillate O-demethylase
LIYRAPIDDASVRLYFVRFYPSAERSLRTLRRDTQFGVYAPLEKDWWGIDVNDQDRMVVEQQGVVANRPNEHLGVSDGGIILVREMMREALAAFEAGQDPPAIIRDPAHQRVDFPQKSVMMNQQQEDVSYVLR